MRNLAIGKLPLDIECRGCRRLPPVAGVCRGLPGSAAACRRMPPPTSIASLSTIGRRIVEPNDTSIALLSTIGYTLPGLCPTFRDPSHTSGQLPGHPFACHISLGRPGLTQHPPLPGLTATLHDVSRRHPPVSELLVTQTTEGPRLAREGVRVRAHPIDTKEARRPATARSRLKEPYAARCQSPGKPGEC